MKTAAVPIFVLMLLVTATSASDVDLSQILSRHNTALDRLKKCSVTTEEEWYLSRADGSPEQLLSTRRCEIRIDGHKTNVLVNEVHDPRGKSPAANEVNYVCADQVLEIFYPHEKFEIRPDVPQAVNGRLAQQTDDEFFVPQVMGHAAMALGMTMFLSPIPVARLISLGKNGPLTRDEYGYRVDGTLPDGTRYKIWFDPDKSFVICRMVFEQSGETLGDNRFQRNRRVLNKRFGFPEKAVISSVVFEIDNVRLEPWKDTHVITALESRKTTTSAEGAKSIERTIHKLKDWNLDPDFSDPASFQPRLPVPEGIRVMVRDTPSLEYNYRNGKIELAVHEKTVESLEDVKLPSRPTAPRVQWLWGIVAVILAVTWWKMRSNAA